MAKIRVSEDLWREFSRVVNMTPSELENWLRAESSGTSTEGRPAHTEAGWRILEILSKDRSDLDEDDATVMESVIGRIRLERRHDLRPTAGDQAWRHRLMALGHDPDKFRR